MREKAKKNTLGAKTAREVGENTHIYVSLKASNGSLRFFLMSCWKKAASPWSAAAKHAFSNSGSYVASDAQEEQRWHNDDDDEDEKGDGDTAGVAPLPPPLPAFAEEETWSSCGRRHWHREHKFGSDGAGAATTAAAGALFLFARV